MRKFKKNCDESIPSDKLVCKGSIDMCFKCKDGYNKKNGDEYDECVRVKYIII